MAGSITQDVFVLNEGFEERRRTTSRGTKSRFTFSTRIDPVIVNLNELHLGKGPAEAIRLAVVNAIKGVAASVSVATILKRKYVKKAYEKGRDYAVRQYTGGRIKTTPPTDSDQLFTNSGRFATGIFVRQNPEERSWTVNVPANRMNESTFTRAQLIEFANRLREHVPVLRDPLASSTVRAAVAGSLERMMTEANERNWKARVATIKAAIEVVRRTVEIVETALGR